MWKYEVLNTDGQQIAEMSGFRTRIEAEQASLQYIEEEDIWDCRIELEEDDG